MNADELKREAASVRLWAKLGLEGKVSNGRLPAFANLLEGAAKGLELAAEIKRESRYPSRWVVFYGGVLLGLILAQIIGG